MCLDYNFTMIPVNFWFVLMLYSRHVGLDSVCEFLNSTQGLDKLYRLLSYLSKLISSLIPIISNEKSLMSLTESFSRLGKNLSHTRTVMRLVGLLHNVRTSRDFKYNHRDEWKSFKGLTRILTNYTYLPCDNLALLGRENILFFDSETIGWFGRTSSQSWFIGLLVEIIDLWKNTVEMLKNFNRNIQTGRLGFKGSLKELKNDFKPNLAKLFLIIGDFPLSINYSLRTPFMSPLMIGVCGTTSSLAALYLRWKSFQIENTERSKNNNK